MRTYHDSCLRLKGRVIMCELGIVCCERTSPEVHAGQSIERPKWERLMEALKLNLRYIGDFINVTLSHTPPVHPPMPFLTSQASSHSKRAP